MAKTDEVAALKRIIEITGALNSTLNVDELLELIMKSASELLNAETSSLLLLDEDSGDLVIHVATGAPGEQVERRHVPPGKGIAGAVLDSGEPTVVSDAKSDPRFYGVMDDATGFVTKNMLALPLKVRDQSIGVVEVINKRDGDWTDDDRDLAGALANQAAIAIDNARLYAKLADAVVTSRMSYRL
ncbi:MAG: GAF domain-containing protein [Actinobacteria bacterium]|nr:MAG: GAF domain-containing protein [Actinomycetota bacterium]